MEKGQLYDKGNRMGGKQRGGKDAKRKDAGEMNELKNKLIH